MGRMANVMRLLLGGVVVLLLMGCGADGPRRVREMADGRRVPDHWSGRVPAVAQDGATRRLDYDSLYVGGPTRLEWVHRSDGTQTWAMVWYRFWPGGQVLEWYREARTAAELVAPTAADGDDFRGASVGRYCVIGEELTIESIGFTEIGPTFLMDKARIGADGSFTLVRPRMTVPAGPYRRVEVGEMRRAPDW